MEEEAMVGRYWCHMCSQMVNPIMEAEIKCPFCQSGFVEEMNGTNRDSHIQDQGTDFGTDHAMSLWAPILFGMINSPLRRRRFSRGEEDDDDDEMNDDHHDDEEVDLEGGIESIFRNQPRNSQTILQLLQGIQAGIASEYESSDNQSVLIQSSMDSNQNQNPLTSLGDYFIGPGIDVLLQHITENDLNRHGTRPASKESIEALPTVKIFEHLQCSICLDDFEKGTEAKEMPCKHKFHSQCILPWLDLHSSCPVCRFELPSVDSESVMTRTMEDNGRNVEVETDDDSRNGSSRRFVLPWPLSGLFASSSSSSASGASNPPRG